MKRKETDGSRASLSLSPTWTLRHLQRNPKSNPKSHVIIIQNFMFYFYFNFKKKRKKRKPMNCFFHFLMKFIGNFMKKKENENREYRIELFTNFVVAVSKLTVLSFFFFGTSTLFQRTSQLFSLFPPEKIRVSEQSASFKLILDFGFWYSIKFTVLVLNFVTIKSEL